MLMLVFVWNVVKRFVGHVAEVGVHLDIDVTIVEVTKMNKLKAILDRCKCGVFLTVNEHRDYYMTAEERLDELYCLESPPRIDDEVRKVMIETDTIINLHFYPDTPIGFHNIYHHDLESALDEALECLGIE